MMPPININCVIPRLKHSPSSPGILGPPREVLPTVLLQAIQSCASSEATNWRFAENVDDFTAEIQWPTNVSSNNKPFLAFPPDLLTIVDKLHLPKPAWSINVTNNILSCRMIWSSLPAISTPAASPSQKPAPTTPPRSSSPQNDSGYLSTPSSSSPSLPRSRLNFAEAVSCTPAATPTVPTKLPLSPVSPPPPPCTTTCSSTQTKAVIIIKQKQPSPKSSSSQTPFPITYSTTTQTDAANDTQTTVLSTTSPPTNPKQAVSCTPATTPTVPTKLPLSPVLSPPPSTTTCSSTQTKAEKIIKQKQPSPKSSSSQTPCPITYSTTTQTDAANDSLTSTVSCQTSANSPPPAPTNFLPSCKLCGTHNVDPQLAFFHLCSCNSHPTKTKLIKQFVDRWAPTQANPNLLPASMSLLIAYGIGNLTQPSSSSSSIQELLVTAVTILQQNTHPQYQDRLRDLMLELAPLLESLTTDALKHLNLPEQADILTIFDYSQDPALDDYEDDGEVYNDVDLEPELDDEELACELEDDRLFT